MGDGPLFHKPKSFLAARQILYTAIFLGVLQFLFSEFNVGMENNGGITALGIIVISYALILFFIKEMSACKKWARTALLVMLIFVMLAYPVVVFSQLRTGLLQMALLVIQAALIIYALVLLYNKKCTEWFNSITHSEMLP